MAGGYEAFVEVLPDFSKLQSRANSELSGILGSAGVGAGSLAGSNIGGGIVGGIKGFAVPILGAIAALGIGRLVGEAIGSGVRYSIDSVGLASDLSETKSAVNTVFGDAADDIIAFSKKANAALGQTQQAALTGAQTFGVFGKSAGLIGKPLSTFSTGLVSLAGDLASFYNSTPDEAIEAIGAGLRGEAEPLRRFGVLLDDATLRSKALELGIYDGNGALTSQQRILAAQAEIFDQTGIAQGDFAKTSDGLANQQRILSASLEDTQAKLGEYLLPGFTTLATYANETLVPALGGIIDKVGPVLGQALEDSAPKIQELLDKVTPLVESFITGAAEDGLPAFLGAMNDLADAAPDWIQAFQDADQAVQDMDAGFRDFQDGLISSRADRIAAFDDFIGSTTGMFGDFFTNTTGMFADFNINVHNFWRDTFVNLHLIPEEQVPKMRDAGQHLVDGIGEGIARGRAGAVHEMEATASAITVAARNIWQIRSPSKVFAEIGGYLASGLALGISDGTPQISSAVRDMVDPSLVNGVSASGGRSAGLSSGGGTTVNMYTNDPYAAGQAVKQELDARLAIR